MIDSLLIVFDLNCRTGRKFQVYNRYKTRKSTYNQSSNLDLFKEMMDLSRILFDISDFFYFFKDSLGNLVKSIWRKNPNATSNSVLPQCVSCTTKLLSSLDVCMYYIYYIYMHSARMYNTYIEIRKYK